MIRVILEDKGVWDTELKTDETVAQLVSRYKTEKSKHFHGNYALRETQTGRVLPENEVLLDARMYYLTAWIVSA